MRPWLTTGDLATIFKIKGKQAAARLAHDLGGVKIAGGWRVPPDAIDQLRATVMPKCQVGSPYPLRSALVSASDPSRTVPTKLSVGWINE